MDGAEIEKLLDHRHIPDVYRAALGFHLCPTGPPATQLALARALRADPRAAGAKLSASTFRNRMRTEPGTVRALWELVDMLVCNAEEARLLTEQASLHTTLDAIGAVIRARDRASAVCVTDGAGGAYLVIIVGALLVASYLTLVVDPTGAGETFAGR